MLDIKTIFYGTSEFGLPTLDWLAANTNLLAVVTTPDKIDVKNAPVLSPIKAWAVDHKVEILQPEKLNDSSFEAHLKSLNLDIGVLVSYGKVVPVSLIGLPKHGTLNLHPSLLPKYRGATPIQAVILAGEVTTGISLMLMNEKVDEGPLIAQKKVVVATDDNYQSLHDKLALEAREIITTYLARYLAGGVQLEPQDHGRATLTKQLKKENGLIDWKSSAEEIEHMVRAYNPWPSAYSKIKNNDTILKIFKARVWEGQENLNPGKILLKDGRMLIGTGTLPLEVLELQVSGGKILSAQDFLRGLRGKLELI